MAGGNENNKPNKKEQSYEELKAGYEKLEARLKRVNDKLLTSEKLKSDFLSNIKNEINNPLTSILGLLRHMVLNPGDTKQSMLSAKLIYNEAYALNFQMQNIFHAAEIEAGQSFPSLSHVNVNYMILKLTEAFKYEASKKDVEFDLELNTDEPFVLDREKLDLILSNLISNAIKFSKDGGHVRIKVSNDDSANLFISIQDDGVGLEQDDLKQIYDRFKQLDTGTRKEFGGHGLGLSVVNSLMEILDGTMTIESEKGKGSLFQISLPVKTTLDIEMQEDDEVLFTNDEEGEVF